ncbi:MULTISPECIES: DUF1697 domain-containing protein [unclassified Ensifer]|uniref:DUF1697 domain-containing protein n=1 Tax=unclassified Ensifer TaxID=2633371 RepID=UPI0008131CCC|nr:MULTISPECIES: DUF1697 domain-containing protein [unclassified Ensifer]OCP07124.1 hypothetical protein BBX50_22385 [Ensifer sp. LC11]OCP07706.1 hypothetical protein BC374_22600 [Ensifer sp. LC13]OCP12132.1 hypothetical protein BC362_06680 [Ensifer sp. LC14]OCP31844.1 hypothetical protein BC364_22100 [Ensifer sp. LC499]
MPVHVALLRAVNVGGTTPLAMADLKAICEGLGFADVKTYIQSGNVLFRSDLPSAEVAAMLDGALEKKIGKAPGVMIRTGAELQAIADRAPFPEAKPNLLHVVFLSAPAPADALEKLVAPDGEEVQLAGSEIYIHFPSGSGRSKFKLPAAKPGTARNLNTVRKLASLALEMEG